MREYDPALKTIVAIDNIYPRSDALTSELYCDTTTIDGI